MFQCFVLSRVWPVSSICKPKELVGRCYIHYPGSSKQRDHVEMLENVSGPPFIKRLSWLGLSASSIILLLFLLMDLRHHQVLLMHWLKQATIYWIFMTAIECKHLVNYLRKWNLDIKPRGASLESPHCER